MTANDKRVKYACYATNVSTSIVANLSPLLFLTFHSLYGVSFTLLGLLVFINFGTQLLIDLMLSLFSDKFNMAKTVKIIPVLTTLGLIIYAVFPYIFPNLVYLGLVIGTIIFAASNGFAEVLLTPVIAALPSENPERETSKLHSVYAWGVAVIIIVGTLFLLFLGNHNWQWLVLCFTAVPVVATILYLGAKIPQMQSAEKATGIKRLFKQKQLWLCVFAIFLGGASECTMGQWASSYLEQALGLPKVWGDIFGVALFSVMLGLGRSLYAKYGKNVEGVLLISAISTALCYLGVIVFNVPILGLICCALTGLCTAMLWPGSLVVGANRMPFGGVFMYAMMAAGGDFGAALVPQLVGVITDVVANSSNSANVAATLGITVEQLSLKAGMLVGLLFPVVAILVFFIIFKGRKNKNISIGDL